VFAARHAVFNCAGLGAEACARGALAHLGGGGAASAAPRLRFAKGNYFELSAAAGPAPFSRLVYPLPEDGGLGIHLTLDLAGRARFGPDVEWLPPPLPLPLSPPPPLSPRERQQQQQQQQDEAPPPPPPEATADPLAAVEPAFDYRVRPSRAREAGWIPAIRSYWPGLPDGGATAGGQQSAGGGQHHPPPVFEEALIPAYSGVRPKLSAPGQPPEDFGVQTENTATWRGGAGHGVKGLVCLYGVESPGLTSALALAEHVVSGAL
jgi:hypothetical protein